MTRNASRTAQDAPGRAIGRRRGKWPVSKYRAVRTTVDGFTFASKAEARRYGDLMLWGRCEMVRNLELQPRFPLHVGGVKVATYVADFRYEFKLADGAWRDVIEDCKGFRTPTYRLKKKHVEAEYGITVQEVR